MRPNKIFILGITLGLSLTSSNEVDNLTALKNAGIKEIKKITLCDARGEPLL